MQAQWPLQKICCIIKEQNILIQNSIEYTKKYKWTGLVQNLVTLINKLLIF
jgi:hypothetical protein